MGTVINLDAQSIQAIKTISSKENLRDLVPDPAREAITTLMRLVKLARAGNISRATLITPNKDEYLNILVEAVVEHNANNQPYPVLSVTLQGLPVMISAEWLELFIALTTPTSLLSKHPGSLVGSSLLIGGYFLVQHVRRNSSVPQETPPGPQQPEIPAEPVLPDATAEELAESTRIQNPEILVTQLLQKLSTSAPTIHHALEAPTSGPFLSKEAFDAHVAQALAEQSTSRTKIFLMYSSSIRSLSNEQISQLNAQGWKIFILHNESPSFMTSNGGPTQQNWYRIHKEKIRWLTGNDGLVIRYSNDQDADMQITDKILHPPKIAQR